MNASYDKNTAVVVLPPLGNGRLHNRGLKVWLARANLTRAPKTNEMATKVIGALGLPQPEHGLAALRLWGQTGDRPTNWIAAADPVYMEPRLDHLCLHALRPADIDAQQLRRLFNHLQTVLAEDKKFGFMRLGGYGYLSAKTPIATAATPVCAVDRQNPDAFIPTGEGAAAYRNLVGEIEMTLHEHEVNSEREANGSQPINSLWLWGGGTAPEQLTRAQPPLFSDDALLTGYWHAATGVSAQWPGSLSACIESSVAGFVAETPQFDDDPELLERCLIELRAVLRSRRLDGLILLFRDGWRAEVRRSHAFRFWRRTLPPGCEGRVD